MRANCIALFGGFIPGLVYFGALWLTVRKGLGATRPATLFLLSALLRMAVVTGAFICIATTHPEQVLLAVGGFEAAKFASIVMVRHGRTITDRHHKEGDPCI